MLCHGLFCKLEIPKGYQQGYRSSQCQGDEYQLDHFNQTVEMVKLGSGSFRKVEVLRLSRMACMIIAENASGKKALVQHAREYFSQTISTTELIQNSLESNILLYKTAQGDTRIEVIFNNETFWMSQKRMADLFGVDVRTINYHLGQIYEVGEFAERGNYPKNWDSSGRGRP